MATPSRASELRATNSGLLQRDVAPEIVKVGAAQATLTTLQTQGRIRVVDNYEFEQYVLPAAPNGVKIVSVDSATQFTVSTDDALYVLAGMQVRQDKDVYSRVTAVDTATGAVTVVSTTGMLANKYVLLGNPAYGEGAAVPTALSRVPDNVTNYVEFARFSYGESRFVRNSKYYGGARQMRNREDCLLQAKLAVERGLWSNAKESITGPPKMYKTGGVLYTAGTAGNVYSLPSNILSLVNLRAAVKTTCRYFPSKDIWLFVSSKGSQLLDSIDLEKAVPTSRRDIPDLGLSCKSYGMGRHNLLVYQVDQLEYDLEDYMVIMDPAGMGIATTKDQSTGRRQWFIEETDVQTPGAATNAGVIDVEFGADLTPAYVWIIGKASTYQV